MKNKKKKDQRVGEITEAKFFIREDYYCKENNCHDVLVDEVLWMERIDCSYS